MKIQLIRSPLGLFCVVLSLFVAVGGGRPLLEVPSVERPSPDQVAAFARWLVSQSSWGVLNTIASDLGGAPFGNVVSFSDGLPGNGRGVPYFYLTTLDPTASNALKDQRSSFTISEYPIGTCGNKDPENPACAKITLVGQLKTVSGNSDEAEFARTALFTKHPEMPGWPKNHDFQIFKLEIDDIFMINWFGGPKPLTVDQYLNKTLNVLSLAGGSLTIYASIVYFEDSGCSSSCCASSNCIGRMFLLFSSILKQKNVPYSIWMVSIADSCGFMSFAGMIYRP